MLSHLFRDAKSFVTTQQITSSNWKRFWRYAYYLSGIGSSLQRWSNDITIWILRNEYRRESQIMRHHMQIDSRKWKSFFLKKDSFKRNAMVNPYLEKKEGILHKIIPSDFDMVKSTFQSLQGSSNDINIWI